MSLQGLWTRIHIETGWETALEAALRERIGALEVGRLETVRAFAAVADQQIIEIAKAISLDARVLIMDEPTAALSGVEVERLFAVARSLRDEGRALVFISHRFDEVFALCDMVTVMRDGEYVATRPVAETDRRRDRRDDGRPRGQRPVPEDPRRCG